MRGKHDSERCEGSNALALHQPTPPLPHWHTLQASDGVFVMPTLPDDDDSGGGGGLTSREQRGAAGAGGSKCAGAAARRRAGAGAEALELGQMGGGGGLGLALGGGEDVEMGGLEGLPRHDLDLLM